MSNDWQDNNENEDDPTGGRYAIGVNTVSLKDSDAESPSAEEEAEGNTMFLEVLKVLKSDRERFIAIALYIGLKQFEIADILKVAYSRVSQINTEMKQELESLHGKK